MRSTTTAALAPTTVKPLECRPMTLSATTTRNATTQAAISAPSIVLSGHPNLRFASAATESPRAS